MQTEKMQNLEFEMGNWKQNWREIEISLRAEVQLFAYLFQVNQTTSQRLTGTCTNGQAILPPGHHP